MNPVSAHASAQTPVAALEPISVVTADFGSGWISHFSTLRNERRDCDKPSEDRAALDPMRQTVVLADGITRTVKSDGTYPVQSPSARAAQLFCETVIARASQVSEIDAETMVAIMSEANDAIASLNREIFPDFDYGERDRAGVAAIVGLLEGETLWLASIADCWCVGAKGDNVTRLAWEKTSQARAEYKRLGEVSAREQLRNKAGNPKAYGACTGEPEAMTFVEYGKVDITGYDRLVFATDGLLSIAENVPLSLATLPTKRLMRLGRLLDKAQQETDDKTLVVLERKPKEPLS
jgi:serine/threonine protein phosphatase PrpC